MKLRDNKVADETTENQIVEDLSKDQLIKDTETQSPEEVSQCHESKWLNNSRVPTQEQIKEMIKKVGDWECYEKYGAKENKYGNFEQYVVFKDLSNLANDILGNYKMF